MERSRGDADAMATPDRPKVTAVIEGGEPFVFVVTGGWAMGVPSDMARLLAGEIIASAAEAESMARAKRTRWKP